MSSGNWLRVNEVNNAIDYLEAAAQFLQEAGEEPLRWKWVAIALHGALYGFAICAIKGTNPPARVLRRDGKLIGIWDALRRCQDPTYMEQYTESQILSLSADEESAIQLLTEELRNEFQHFQPKGWSIEISGMPTITKRIIRVIRFLALECFNVLLEEIQERRVRKAIETVESSV